MRAEIAASSEPISVLAKRYGIAEQTASKWHKRTDFADRSHTAHRLQIQLTPAQEIVVVHLRTTLLLPLDDLLAVTKEFIWTGACVAMEWATSMLSSPPRLRSPTKPSRATRQATCAWM